MPIIWFAQAFANKNFELLCFAASFKARHLRKPKSKSLIIKRLIFVAGIFDSA